MSKPKIHETAVVDASAKLGAGTVIWSHACICPDVVMGEDCRIGHRAYVDRGVRMGDRCALQTGASIFRPFELGDDVFIGPHACLTNDRDPYAYRIRDLGDATWKVHDGAAVGAGAIVLADIEIERHVLIAAGAVVTRPTTAYGVYIGSPARLVGFRCPCKARLPLEPGLPARCPECDRSF